MAPNLITLHNILVIKRGDMMKGQLLAFGGRALACIPVPVFSEDFKSYVKDSTDELQAKYRISNYDYACMLLCMSHYLSIEITVNLHIPEPKPLPTRTPECQQPSRDRRDWLCHVCENRPLRPT